MAAPMDQVVRDVEWLRRHSDRRRLIDSAKWAAEMLFYLPESDDCAATADEASGRPSKAMRLAVACMDCQEFNRAARLLAVATDALSRFVHFYARFLAGEKQRLDDEADVNESATAADSKRPQRFANCHLNHLHRDLGHLINNDHLDDAFLLYLHGLVLARLDLTDAAVSTLCRALEQAPALWPAWAQLAALLDSKDQLNALHLPSHWMKDLFLADVYLKLQMHADANGILNALRDSYFVDCPYVITKSALALYGLKEVSDAIELFEKVREEDPYRLEHMDTYSSTLFVAGKRLELAALAHHFYDANKYTAETCFIVGNYYSLRNDHERSVLYFQRALKLEPRNADAWTLMGHEFMELKNTSAACHAYHQALEIDRNDFRAWYALGQMYDILHMPSHATYYYNVAHRAKPEDSRMMIALGEMYQKQGRSQHAVKCFWQAHCVGDIEGQALVKLTKLFEADGDVDQAASCAHRFLQQLEQRNERDDENQSTSYRFLADYYLKREKFDDAQTYAQLCVDYDSTREDGKAFLKRISHQRNSNGAAGASMQVDSEATPDSKSAKAARSS